MRIALIDDHALVRRGVREMLESRGMCVVVDLDPGPGVLCQVAAKNPDVLVLDLAMPEPGGLALLKEWKRRFPAVPVLILSMHVEQPWASWAVDAGADGYLSKSTDPDRLVEALRDLQAGRPALGPEIRAVLERSRQQQRPGNTPPKLTPRESEVLKKVCQGATLANLADHFVISHNTAKSHLHSLYRKMKVSDRAQLLLVAKEMGLEFHPNG